MRVIRYTIWWPPGGKLQFAALVGFFGAACAFGVPNSVYQVYAAYSERARAPLWRLAIDASTAPAASGRTRISRLIELQTGV